MTLSEYHVFPGDVSRSEHLTDFARKLFTSKRFLQEIRARLEFATRVRFRRQCSRRQTARAFPAEVPASASRAQDRSFCGIITSETSSCSGPE